MGSDEPTQKFMKQYTACAHTVSCRHVCKSVQQLSCAQLSQVALPVVRSKQFLPK